MIIILLNLSPQSYLKLFFEYILFLFSNFLQKLTRFGMVVFKCLQPQDFEFFTLFSKEQVLCSNKFFTLLSKKQVLSSNKCLLDIIINKISIKLNLSSNFLKTVVMISYMEISDGIYQHKSNSQFSKVLSNHVLSQAIT